MPTPKYLNILTPIAALVIGLLVSQYFSSFRVSFTPRHWLADIQYTHLAITENLSNGNGSIFYPKSYILDPDGGGANQTLDGLGEARFPVLNWAIAKCAHNSTEQINAWRHVSLFFYLASILFIYLTLYKLTKNLIASLVATLGLSFTSVALFAQDSIGTFTSTYALVLASFYFFVCFLFEFKKIQLYLALFLASWASLQGHGSILVLISIFGLLFIWDQKQKENKHLDIISYCIFALGSITFLYNRVYLFNKNGGLFEIGKIMQGGIRNVLDTNSKFMYSQSYNISNVFIAFFIFIGCLLFLYLKLYKKLNSEIFGKLGEFVALVLGLNILYFILYLPGIFEKDFYLMESLLPSLILAASFSVSYILSNWPLKKIYFYILSFSIFFLSISSVKNAYKLRFIETDENRVQKSLDNLKHAKTFLDKLNISPNEKISLINGYGGNMSLMKTGRIGYVSDGTSIDDFKRLLDHEDSQYILSQDQFFMYDVVNAYPQILSKIKLVATNEVLSLYKKRSSSDSTSGEILMDYVQCHNKKNFQLFSLNFEKTDTLNQSWFIKGNVLSDSGYYSKHCLEVKEEVEFPSTLEVEVKSFGKKPKGVVITGMFYTEKELRKVCFNMSCHKSDEDKTQYFVEEFKISKKLKGEGLNKWTRVSCKVTFPDEIKMEDVIKVYLWNPNKGEFVMDDFSFIFY